MTIHPSIERTAVAPVRVVSGVVSRLVGAAAPESISIVSAISVVSGELGGVWLKVVLRCGRFVEVRLWFEVVVVWGDDRGTRLVVDGWRGWQATSALDVLKYRAKLHCN